MFFNYLKLSIRLMSRNPFFALINIVGLSAGFAVFLILWQFAQFELDSDQFTKDYDRTVRLAIHYRSKPEEPVYEVAITEPQVAKELAKQFPEVESLCRVFLFANLTRSHAPDHDKKVYFETIDRFGARNAFAEEKVAYVDANFPAFFSRAMIEGSSSRALSTPNSVIITNKIAKKYFGDGSVVGKTLMLNGTIALQVAGVVESMPPNSHLDLDILISTATIEKSIVNIVLSTGGPFCYFKLQPGTDMTQLEQRINSVAKTLSADVIRQCGVCDINYFFQPLENIPFDHTYWFDQHKPRSKAFLYTLSGISVIILIMAWINFINLTASSNQKRMKEIGARKTVGARLKDFMAQFILESFLTKALAFLIALTWVQLAKFPAEHLLGFYVPDVSDISWQSVLIVASLSLAGIVLTGIYPAYLTIRYSTFRIFSKGVGSGMSLSKVLTPLQFAFALILIISVFSIALQIEHVIDKSTRPGTSDVIVVDLPFRDIARIEERLNAFANTATTVPGVKQLAVSSYTLVENRVFVLQRNNVTYTPNTNGGVDDKFIPLYNIKLLAGRNFFADNPSDRSSIILSETCAKSMGFESPEEAIGQKIKIEKNEWQLNWADAEIIGVVEDYRVFPLFAAVVEYKGIALTFKNFLVEDLARPRQVSIRLGGSDVITTIEKVKDVFDASFEGDLFNWYFIANHMTRAYEPEKVIRNQIYLFTSIAIGIACLGLLGMISNKAVEKIKEIGIRKVLGANGRQIAVLLLTATTRQILISIAVGVPLSYYLIQRYLEKFSDKITLHWWHFALPIVLLFGIMLCTVVSVVWKAVRSNTVYALKNE